MATTNPQIAVAENGVLYDHQGNRICAIDPTPTGHTAWRQWARNPRNKSFNYTSSKIEGLSFTAIVETRAAGSGPGHRRRYWYASRTVDGQKQKAYIAPDRKISLASLERAAKNLVKTKLEDAADEKQDRQQWQQARRQIRRRPPPPRREMPADPSEPGGQLPLWS